MEDFGIDGYVYADRFVRNIIENIVDFSELISKNDNFKDSLQRYFQSLKLKPPVYYSFENNAPLYRRVFSRYIVITKDKFDLLSTLVQNNILKYNSHFNTIDKSKIICGVGTGIKVINAEQECACVCLQNLLLDINF